MISFLLIYCFLFNQVFAEILFSQIFSNTSDDKNLEYVELYNSWNLDKSLSWYILKDKSKKKFIFWSWEILESFSFKKYFRKITSILLNNTWDDLYLYNLNWGLEDSFSYTWTTKWEVIKIISFNTWAIISNSWNLVNASWSILIDSWSLISNSWKLLKNTLGVLNNSWVIENSWSIVFSEWIENNSWDIITQTWVIISSWIIEYNSWTFLEEENNDFNLKFSFQNPSYILEKEKILEKYICDNSKDKCKINLDLRGSFSWRFNEKDYDCNIDFWFDWWISSEENKCNPSTVIFPKWSYDLKFKIIEKTNTWNIFTWWFILENKIEPEIIEKEIIKEVEVEKIIEKNNCISWWSIWKIENKIKIQKPEIIIQSWLGKNNNCKKEDCSINLKYEENDKLEKCEWDFSWWIFKWETDKKCNPWYVKYPLWNFSIILKVYEKNNKNNYKQSVLNFSNIKKENIKQKDKSKIINNFLEENNIKTDTWIINENNILRYIKFWNININPKWKDDSEYVEIINYSSWKINLSWCYLDDILKKWSKKYIFKSDYFLEKNETKKIYKKESKIIFNNNFDEVNLICDWNLIDKIKWDFTIREEYILNNEKLIVRNKIDEINKKIKVNKVKNSLDVVNLNKKIISWEIKLFSDENKIQTIFQPIIEIQWKIWENKKLENWKIICYDTCSINFDWSKSVGNIEKYLWDFWNWEKYEWKNPWYIRYKKYWKYKVILKVISNNLDVKKEYFLVNFMAKDIIKKHNKKKLSYSNKKEKIILKNVNTENINELKTKNIKNKKIEVLFYILIFIFSLNLIVLILKKEKLL